MLCLLVLLQNLTSFQFLGRTEDGKGRCPFDPAQSYTSVMVGESHPQAGTQPVGLPPSASTFPVPPEGPRASL